VANLILSDVLIAGKLLQNILAPNAILQGLIKMASVIITLKIMPISVEADLKVIEDSAKKIISDFSGESEFKSEIEPIAFGLKALKLTFVMDESKGSTEDLEKKISELENVNSVECVDVRRTVG